jgi:hypothetical protein
MEGKITMTTILSLSLIFSCLRENGCLFYQEVSLEMLLPVKKREHKIQYIYITLPIKLRTEMNI